MGRACRCRIIFKGLLLRVLLVFAYALAHTLLLGGFGGARSGSQGVILAPTGG